MRYLRAMCIALMIMGVALAGCNNPADSHDKPDNLESDSVSIVGEWVLHSILKSFDRDGMEIFEEPEISEYDPRLILHITSDNNICQIFGDLGHVDGVLHQTEKNEYTVSFRLVHNNIGLEENNDIQWWLKFDLENVLLRLTSLFPDEDEYLHHYFGKT